MQAPETNSDIDRAAAAWIARIDKGPLSETERRQFDNWLKGDTRRRGAFARAEAVFELTSRARIYIPSVANDAGPSPRASRRQILLRAGGAAAAVLLGLALSNFDTQRFQTKRGELRSVPLEDGSMVTLNTDSEIQVRYRESVREVVLLKGEAIFEVAESAIRPFVVTAGRTVVRAVGTSFSVRALEDGPLEVLVDHGAVDMFRESLEERVVRVPANFRAVSLEMPSPSVRLVEPALSASDVARRLAWRQGYLSIVGETLRYAVAEVNRYNDLQIVVDDPEILDKAIVGRYWVHNSLGFAQSVAESLELKIEVHQNRIMLWR